MSCMFAWITNFSFALLACPDNHSPRQARCLDFISQFTADIRHLPGHTNAAADTLSRMDVDALEHTSHPYTFLTQRKDESATAAASS